MRLVVIALAAGLVFAAPAERVSSQPRVRVLVELFTSQGCSSCPPADDLLARLVREQPIAGIEVIALSEHVDYWNQLGWRDPFSSSRFTASQELYARHFDGNGMYTPQVVVDGRAQMVGNDWTAIQKALAAAAVPPKAVVDVQARAPSNGRTVVRVEIRDTPVDPRGDVDVMLAMVENGLVVDVKRGENARRRLRHDAVVRRLEKIGTLSRNARSGSFSWTVAISPQWSAAALKAVAFLQHRRSGHVLGVSASTGLLLSGTP